MNSVNGHLARIDAEIEEAERLLAGLRASREAFIEVAGADPDAKTKRRRRRTKREMLEIRARIRSHHDADPTQQPSAIWRKLVAEGVLDNGTHERDTVSKEVRRITEEQEAVQAMGSAEGEN